MAIQAIGLKAYTEALNNFTKSERNFSSQANQASQASQIASQLGNTKPQAGSFGESLANSLGKVNNLQLQKNDMVEAFASGETQNVHELMISLQKASLAMKLTSAVRNKVLDAYKELSKLQF